MTQEREPTTLERAAEAFRRTGVTAQGDDAPLYAALCPRIAADPELLEIATHARPTQSLSYLLFDAVQYLVLGGTDHPIAGYYGSVTEKPLDAATAFPVFRDFVLKNADRLRQLIENHNNQTNEVGRMSALLLAISEAARRGGRKPLGIVEVGPSAGLNLVFDRYFFDYGRVTWGDPKSPVHVRCEIEDDVTPPLEAGVPTIAYRVGLDIEPVVVDDDDAARWMLSSTWPDHQDLHRMQRQAIEVLRQDPPRIVQGDALDVLPLLEAVPPELTLVVYQSFMLMHLSPEGRQSFLDILAGIAARRPLYFVSMNGAGIGGGARRARVDLYSWVDGKPETQQLVEGHSHGRSVRWVAGATA